MDIVFAGSLRGNPAEQRFTFDQVASLHSKGRPGVILAPTDHPE
jgi:hypothetical protein